MKIKLQTKKITGEKFKLLIMRYLPFVEVLIISRNQTDANLETISKYDSRCGKSANDYYAEIIQKHIDRAIETVFIYRRLVKRFEANSRGKVIKSGRHSFFETGQLSAKYWEKSKNYLCNPVRKSIWLRKNDKIKGIVAQGVWILSGESALAEWIEVNPPKVPGLTSVRSEMFKLNLSENQIPLAFV